MLSRGVAAVELGLDLGVEVVVGVLGLPVAAGHAEGVLDGAVGDVGSGGEFWDQEQAFAMVATVGGEAVLEGRADVELAVGTAELDELGEFLTVAFDVGVGGHGNGTRPEFSGKSRVLGGARSGRQGLIKRHQFADAPPPATRQVAKVAS